MLQTISKSMVASWWRVAVTVALLVSTYAVVDPVQAQDRKADIRSNRISVVLKPGNGAIQLASLERPERLRLRVVAKPNAARTETNQDANELNCLARAIYFEARGESDEGRAAVGSVILNRVHSGAYPDTVCKVVYQNAQRMNRCQFSFACDGVPDVVDERTAWNEIEDLAERLLKECGPPSAPVLLASTHYHARSVFPRWARKLEVTGEIGQHIFYRDKSA